MAVIIFNYVQSFTTRATRPCKVVYSDTNLFPRATAPPWDASPGSHSPFPLLGCYERLLSSCFFQGPSKDFILFPGGVCEMEGFPILSLHGGTGRPSASNRQVNYTALFYHRFFVRRILNMAKTNIWMYFTLSSVAAQCSNSVAPVLLSCLRMLSTHKPLAH